MAGEAAGDVHHVAIYGAKNRIVVPIFDADGDLVAGAAGLSATISRDQGTPAATTNTPVEIGSSFGFYYVDLTDTECQAKSVTLVVKTTTTGAKNTPRIIPLRRFPILRSGTAQGGGASSITLDSTASSKDGAYVGTLVRITNSQPSAGALSQARTIISYAGSSKIATVQEPWGVAPTSASTFEMLLPDGHNVNAWFGQEVASWNVAGVPKVDVADWLGSAPNALIDGKLDSAPSNGESGTAQAGGASTLTLRSGASSTDQLYRYDVVSITSGTGAGQSRVVTNYAGSTKVATVDESWAVNPDSSSKYVVTSIRSNKVDANGRVDVGLWTGSAPNALQSGRVDASVGGYQSGQAPLQPTTAGRTLDVSSGGEAGVDWANVGSPSTAVNLSGTTVGIVSTVNALASAAVQSVWDFLLSSISAAGSIGKLIKDNLDAAISSRASSTDMGTVLGRLTSGRASNLDNLDATVSSRATQTSVNSLQTDVTTLTPLPSRLTAVRAGYLDNLNVGGLVASASDVNSIQNNTRFVSGTPTEVVIPLSGQYAFKVTGYFYDESGHMEDPDGNEIAVRIRSVRFEENQTGFFDDSAGTTASTASTTFTPDYYKMVREAQGVYGLYYVFDDGEFQPPSDNWVVDFALKENSQELHYTRSISILDEAPGEVTLANSTINYDIIASAIRSYDTSALTQDSNSIEKRLLDQEISGKNEVISNIVINRGLIDGVKAKTDQFEFPGGKVKATLFGETVGANLIQIEGSPTVEDLPITQMLRNIISALQGDVDRSGNTYTFRSRTGDETFTYTVSDNGRVGG
jgi:hypothetical protein